MNVLLYLLRWLLVGHAWSIPGSGYILLGGEIDQSCLCSGIFLYVTFYLNNTNACYVTKSSQSHRVAGLPHICRRRSLNFIVWNENNPR